MKIFKPLILSCFFVIQSFIDLNGQITKEEMTFLVKLSIFQECSTQDIEMNENTFNNFLNIEFDIDTLKSENFDDFMFLSISPNFNKADNISLKELPIVPGNCEEYIVGFYRNVSYLYRLKGYKINDFPSFIQLLRRLDFPKTGSGQSFSNYYFIENIDLGCLFDSYIKFKFDKEKYPCLMNCSDMSIVY